MKFQSIIVLIYTISFCEYFVRGILKIWGIPVGHFLSLWIVLTIYIVGVHNELLPDVPLCYVDYFELKSTDPVGPRETSASLNYLAHNRRNTLFGPIYVTGQTNNPWTICSSSCPAVTLWSPNVPYFILSSECYIHLIFPFCLRNSHICSVSDSLMYVRFPCVWN